MTPLNINELRKNTPGCAYVTHFNNAGASLPPLPVLEAVQTHLQQEALQGGYEAAKGAIDKINNFYINAAQLIHSAPQEIAFMDNATRAWDMAFYSLNLKNNSFSTFVTNHPCFIIKQFKT